MAFPSPLRALRESTNRTYDSPLSPIAPNENPLAFLASIALPAPACSKDALPGTTDLFECCEELFATARPRCPSRDGVLSRTSSGEGSVPGRMYACRFCNREYASTDAVRKHARMVHPEWIKAQGQGCASLYCTPIVDAPLVLREPQSTAAAHPVIHEEPSIMLSMFAVAESFVALSKAAAASAAEDEDVTRPRLASEEYAPPTWDASRKRPRTVRCGKCDACVREDCGECKNCVDKPKFGGVGQRKQGCIKKVCRSRVKAA